MAIVDSARLVVGGVDTHRDFNVAAVVDMNGGLLGVESFPTTLMGIGRCRRGCWRSARSNGSASREPARTGRASPGISLALTWL